MKKNRILLLINSLGVGGAEKVFVEDANALVQKGYDVYFAVLYASKSESEMWGKLTMGQKRIWKLDFINLYDWRSYLSFIRMVRKENIGLVYSTLDDANFVSKVVRFFAGFKLFCREANLTQDKPIKFKVADIILNFFVHKLVMVAEAVKCSYASYDPFHKSKMVVLYNGVFVPECVIRSKNIDDPVRMVAVGSFTEKKGFLGLVEIFKDCIVSGNNYTLEIIGTGPLYTSVSAKIKEWGLEDKITCPGVMDKEVLKKKYLQADIFLLTSKKEGCPNVLLEAMSYGIAPVCYSVGAVPEIIENDISGIVISPGDQESFGKELKRLIDNPQEVENLGLSARERIEDKFSFEMHLKNLISILES